MMLILGDFFYVDSFTGSLRQLKFVRMESIISLGGLPKSTNSKKGSLQSIIYGKLR